MATKPSPSIPAIDYRAPTAVLVSAARSCVVLRGSKKILAIRDQIRALRVHAGQQEDITTDPEWFVSVTVARKYNPWIVLLFEGQKLVAAMHVAENCFFGLPIGYLKAQGVCEDFLICCPDRRSMYLPLLLKGLFAEKRALIAQVMQPADSETALIVPEDSGAQDVEWKRALSHHRVLLRASMEETLAPYGPHTRRNIRYYLRKSRADGCSFVSWLSAEERLQAVKGLVNHVTHKISLPNALRREAAMQAVPNAFAMGVRAAGGSWLSYLAGWREGERTFVYWQMNRVVGKSSSMCTAIRSFLMEEEIARGATEINFVGGSSGVFKRCCVGDKSLHLIVRRQGLRGWALSRLLERAVVPGHPLRLVENDVMQGT